MAEQQRNKIHDMVENLHDDTLLKPDESPNGNPIYHLYSDGQITYQKGGFAYGQRSEFDIKYPIGENLNLDIGKFRYSRVANRVEYGYIITTYENALLIRAEMETLVELINKVVIQE